MFFCNKVVWWIECNEIVEMWSRRYKNVQSRNSWETLLNRSVCIYFLRTIFIIYCTYCIRFNKTINSYEIRILNRILKYQLWPWRLRTSLESLIKLNRCNVIYKHLVHTSISYTFLLHCNLLTIVYSHNTTIRWTLNLKKSGFVLLSRLSVQIRKCRSDVL